MLSKKRLNLPEVLAIVLSFHSLDASGDFLHQGHSFIFEGGHVFGSQRVIHGRLFLFFEAAKVSFELLIFLVICERILLFITLGKRIHILVFWVLLIGFYPSIFLPEMNFLFRFWGSCFFHQLFENSLWCIGLFGDDWGYVFLCGLVIIIILLEVRIIGLFLLCLGESKVPGSGCMVDGIVVFGTWLSQRLMLFDGFFEVFFGLFVFFDGIFMLALSFDKLFDSFLTFFLGFIQLLNWRFFFDFFELQRFFGWWRFFGFRFSCSLLFIISFLFLFSLLFFIRLFFSLGQFFSFCHFFSLSLFFSFSFFFIFLLD